MKRLNDDRMKLVLVGLVATLVFGSGSAKADFTFGEPMNMGPKINTIFMESGGSLSSDGLMFFFDCDKPDHGKHHIYMVIRDTIDDDWNDPVGLGPVINDQMYSEIEPAISSDGLELYYSFGAPFALGVDRDLYLATRSNSTDSWANPVSLGPLVNGPGDERGPSISGDGLSLYFESDRPDGLGGWDLWVTTRSTRDDDWGAPVNLGPMLNSPGNDFAPSITSDGLALIFSSARPSSTGQYPDLWVTTRRSTSDPWREPINLGPIINTDDENGAEISPDGSMLFITYWERPGGYGYNDIWQVPIIPIVDFNGDGFVDALDMCIIVNHWGTNNSLCDIGPTPFGNGIVDVQDLIVLSEYLFEGVSDPTLVAHWELDEMEGSMARNSISGEDALVLGDPLWLPAGGMVDGALQLDGVDDCVITSSGINPADGPFSVVAWINDGAPGQAIISQQVVSDWLILDAEGQLMTELKGAGRSDSGPLISDALVTNGNWHRIGLVWDGSCRRLYMDGVEVACDTEPLSNLESSDRALYIGVGKDYTASTFFSGMIDDIRIYNRVVHP